MAFLIGAANGVSLEIKKNTGADIMAHRIGALLRDRAKMSLEKNAESF